LNLDNKNNQQTTMMIMMILMRLVVAIVLRILDSCWRLIREAESERTQIKLHPHWL
jgi:uncharacterized membrane protein affecting hemolysin expression